MSIIRTDSLQCEQLAPFINMNENQLKHLYEPQEGVFVAESPVVIERAYDGGYTYGQMCGSSVQKSDKMAIVLGTESNGLRPDTMKACDYIVKIPMKEGVDSLNVAAAAAVAFWELRQR